MIFDVVCFMEVWKLNICCVALKACSVLSKTDECESARVLLHHDGSAEMKYLRSGTKSALNFIE